MDGSAKSKVESGREAAGGAGKDPPQGSVDEKLWATLGCFKSPGKVCILEKNVAQCGESREWRLRLVRRQQQWSRQDRTRTER